MIAVSGAGNAVMRPTIARRARLPTTGADRRSVASLRDATSSAAAAAAKGARRCAWDRDAFENAMIEDMRAHGGAVTSGPLAGHPLLIMTSTGAKSGEPRRAILTYSEDGGDYVVAGTAGGSPTTPAWVHNVEADPRRDDRGREPAPARRPRR